MKVIYEVVDYSNDEMYFPLGVFLSVEDAVKALVSGFESDSYYSEAGCGYGKERFEIIERKIGMTGSGEAVWEVEREEYFSTSDDKFFYKTTMNRAYVWPKREPK